MITEIEDYFLLGCGRCERHATDQCSSRRWSAGLEKLRALCLSAGLIETVKWGHPCYVHAGRNIAIIGAFRADFRLTFFNAALMRDPAGILQKQGEATRHPDMIRFTASEDVDRLKQAIAEYLLESMSYAQSGIRPEKIAAEHNWPDELVEAMDADPILAEAFHALTPGRQNSYLINLNGAKSSATRISRIEKFRPRILSGKGANERLI